MEGIAPIKVVRTHNAVAIALSQNAASDIIELNRYVSNGYFSLQYYVTGDGTVKFEYQLSNDGVNFVEPSSASDIASSITKTSGPGSDGRDLVSFSPPPAAYMKIVATETGGANSVTVTLDLCMH